MDRESSQNSLATDVGVSGVAQSLLIIYLSSRTAVCFLYRSSVITSNLKCSSGICSLPLLFRSALYFERLRSRTKSPSCSFYTLSLQNLDTVLWRPWRRICFRREGYRWAQIGKVDIVFKKFHCRRNTRIGSFCPFSFLEGQLNSKNDSLY